MSSHRFLVALILLATPCMSVTLEPDAFGTVADGPIVADLEARRAWIVSQPRTFENKVLFRTHDGEIVRSDRFTETSGLFGDFDGDGDIDRYDYTALQICLSFSGPAVPTPPACDVFDSDGDEDIDMADVAAFAAAMTGSLSTLHVEAGELVPIVFAPQGYYSGEPGTAGNNALNGIAAQAGYTQDDLWYRWRPLQRPVGSGHIVVANASRPTTAYTILSPALSGSYGFGLTVTNLVTGEIGFDAATLSVVDCFNDGDCDDGLFCNGVDRCREGACTVDSDSPCGALFCDEAGDRCIGCVENLQCNDGNPCTSDICSAGLCVHELRADGITCDDGLFCTLVDTCLGGACVGAGTPCPDSPRCNESTDSCVQCLTAGDCGGTTPLCDPATNQCVACLNAADCADGNACTTDICQIGGTCIWINNSLPCDDGVFCNGAETCSVGVCAIHDGNPCTTSQICDEDNDVCMTPQRCVTNADCDDDLFCNGVETCGFGDTCVPGADPCQVCPGAACDEDNDRCGEQIVFTLSQDNLTGTCGDDLFVAPLVFHPGSGSNLPSLQTGDIANGGDSSDALNAQFNFGAATTVAPTLVNIETINITDFGTAATTLPGAGITGATLFNFGNSANTNVFRVTGLPTLANVGVTNQAVGAALSFVTATTSGGSDAITLTLKGMTAGTLTFTTGTTNGIETLNIASNTAASTVADIVMNGTTLTTVNVSGDAAFTQTASLDSNVTTVNASTATGAVTLLQSNVGVFSFTGGAGDDTIILGATYGTTDTINGGAGTGDTLGGTTAVIAGTSATQSNVTKIEKLRVSNELVGTINLTHFGTISEVVLDDGANVGIISNAATGFKVSSGLRAGAVCVGTSILVVTVAGSGTSDTLTYTLNDCEQAGAVTFTGVETLNLVSNLDLDGSAADSGTAGQNTLTSTLILTDTAALEKVVVTGTEQLNLTGAVTANEINAGGFAQPLIMGAAMTNSGVTVTGGSGDDTLFGSAGNDIMNGGAGNDIINPLAGNDIVTGGSGADTFRQSAAAASGADRQTITDFDDTATTGDVFNLNSGLATLTGTDNFATSATIQTHSASGNLAVNAAAEVVVVRSATVTDLTSANSLTGTNLLTAIGGTITGAIVGQNDILLVVADTSGNVGVYYASSADNAIIAGEITLVAVLQGANVAIANLVFNNFTNGA